MILETGLALGTLGVGAMTMPFLAKARGKRSLQVKCMRRRTLVLTYDDGPGEKTTSAILDELATHGAKATFFIQGMRVAAHEDLMHRMVRAGHEIGCHTHAHLHPFKTAPWRSYADVTRGYRSMGQWIEKDAVFRPPYGKLTPWVWMLLSFHRAPIGWWTLDSGDTHPQIPDPLDIVEQVRDRGGAVVLMHDFERQPERREFVIRTTRSLLGLAKEMHLDVCPLGELLRPGNE